jgi:hypothetical protein
LTHADEAQHDKAQDDKDADGRDGGDENESVSVHARF